MIEPEFLDSEVVQYLHDQALKAYGGIAGLKDENMLMSALSRPMNQFAYAEPGRVDLFDLAAAYAFGIVSNHPFNDGNKRTAWATCVLFLDINGYALGVATPDVTQRMPLLATRQLTESAFAEWIRRVARPSNSGVNE